MGSDPCSCAPSKADDTFARIAKALGCEVLLKAHGKEGGLGSTGEVIPRAQEWLYACISEATLLDRSYLMGGNRIDVRTVDLGREFREISAQLARIAGKRFGRKAEVG